MAHNTMFKHLAKHIKDIRTGEIMIGAADRVTVDKVLDMLVVLVADEMDERMPGSFERNTFFEQSGTEIK